VQDDLPLSSARDEDRRVPDRNGTEPGQGDQYIERAGGGRKKAFLDEWAAINADRYIFNTMRLSRIYGIASIAMLVKGRPSESPVKFEGLDKANISYSIRCIRPDRWS
jgi:hypothetical protein